MIVVDHLLPYAERLDPRSLADIRTVVIHCTELPDLAMARTYGEQVHYSNGSGNSGHYYIDRDGRCERYVPDERIANHTRGWNPGSIGIELVNSGRYPDWLHTQHQAMSEAYPQDQIAALIELMADLRRRCPSLDSIAGHEDLDQTEVPATDDPTTMVRRKRDPGPLFPWDQVLQACALQRRVAVVPAAIAT